MLPDGNGVELAQQLKQMVPNLQVIMMTGSMLPPEEEAICEEHEFPVLRKPFLARGRDESDPRPAGGRTTGGRYATPRRFDDCDHHARIVCAGWSSLVARWAHNPKVEGSNPSPATNFFNWLRFLPALLPHQLLTDC